ncbi:hypothetical protein GCM10010123_09520 [Pilimelia anulata]|uniref:Deoxyribonuclease NucA/NucB domain-containing protein n=1 Tax=Pilimelia anulata TaxID=53371 RepID=A0A8J3FBA9_9ACTN|nr:hypothetical protein GCM10010123_09520 [Pilimelia anulata]
MTRLTDKDKQAENSRVACPSSLPRPPGQQCDEYPMASTWQGAAITVSFSRRMIDKDNNEIAGQELNAFYLADRIIEKDPFYVAVDLTRRP